MAELFQNTKVTLRRTPVIASEKDNRVVIDSCLFQGGHKLADMVVNLHDKIGVRIHSTGILERRHWNDRRVGSRKGEVQKERLTLLSSGRACLNVVDAFLKQVRQDLVDVEI